MYINRLFTYLLTYLLTYLTLQCLGVEQAEPYAVLDLLLRTPSE